MAEKKQRDFEPLPYYRWYWRAWRSSRAVQRMSWEARGLYRELLDECWAKGGVPDDMDLLAEICGCPAEVISTHWNTLQQMFTFVEPARVWVNERLENERTDSDKVRAAKSLAGIASAEARRKNRTSVNRVQQSSTDVNSSSSSRAKAVALNGSGSTDDSSERQPDAAPGPEGPRVTGADHSGPESTGSIFARFRDMLAMNGVRPPGPPKPRES